MINLLGERYMDADCGIEIDTFELTKGLLVVLIPVPIGMFILHRDPLWGKIVEKVCSRIGLYFILIAILQQAATNKAIYESEWYIWVSAFVMFMAGSSFGYWIARLMCLSPRQARTICLETGIQSTTVTMAIILLSFPATASDVAWRKLVTIGSGGTDGSYGVDWAISSEEAWNDPASRGAVRPLSRTRPAWASYAYDEKVAPKGCDWVAADPDFKKGDYPPRCDTLGAVVSKDYVKGKIDDPWDGSTDYEQTYAYERCFTECVDHPKFSDPGQELQDKMMAFPLLFTLFLLLGGASISLYFWHSSRYEKEDEEKAKEAAKVNPDGKDKEKKASKPYAMPSKPTLRVRVQYHVVL